MNKGHLLQVGSPAEIYERPATLFVANFIGSPSMNFIPCTFDKNAASLVIDFGDGKDVYPLPGDLQSKTSGLSDGATLLIGIRPENVLVAADGSKSATMQLNLKLTENLGSENIHHLERGKIHLVARTDSDVVFKDGSSVYVSFREDSIRLFDPQTEKAIA
jgi:ABC-type sugar transport system ATPase subunit